jgi:zinc/manganese transport system substrate-binding protein
VVAKASSHSPKISTGTKQNTGGPVQVIAAENFWGSIAAQVGGNRVKVTSIITNPDTDPHDYEPKPTDARLVANAKYTILNGAGYDAWGQKLLDANPVEGRKVLNIGDLVGKHEGDNPHLWYSPEYVTQAAKQMAADLESLDPADAAYFEQQNKRFNTVTLKPYHQLIGAIKQKYQGTAVGSTESIFIYMADALGLKLTTPPSFMNAIAENQEPTAADKATFDQQVAQKQIKVLVYNKQTVTPDTTALEQKAQASGIPIVGITETLAPPTLSFQAWQDQELQAIQQALAKSTGR